MRVTYKPIMKKIIEYDDGSIRESVGEVTEEEHDNELKKRFDLVDKLA